MKTEMQTPHPRPDFERQHWQSLCGTWDFAFDSRPLGAWPMQITVPYCYQCKKSGIGETSYHACVWYRKYFTLSETELRHTILLKFGAVDYACCLYVNGIYVGVHEGGYTEFCFDITHFVVLGENEIVLSVQDDRDLSHPRGKQYWKDTPDRCWYTEVTGIWKSVWLEFTDMVYVKSIHCTPNIDDNSVRVDVELNDDFCGDAGFMVTYDGETCAHVISRIQHENRFRVIISIPFADGVDEIHYWSPEHPNLYRLTITVGEDCVKTYFGMRSIEVRGDRILLNHRPLYQRLILDQGYWPDSLITPPDAQALLTDLKLVKAMGFNGIRMHQKNEDPMFYFYADELGLLVWLEMPSPYEFCASEINSVVRDWSSMIAENYNHPSIITYVPFNESWGIRKIAHDSQHQALANTLYWLTKSLDPTRLISSNDGWEFPSCTDLYGVHDYFGDTNTFSRHFADSDMLYRIGIMRPLQIHENPNLRCPILLTEFGGIAFDRDLEGDAWGYNDAAESDTDYFECLKTQMDAIKGVPYLQGYCYTQLTDVMQEANGLLKPDRTLKLPIEKLYELFGK